MIFLNTHTAILQISINLHDQGEHNNRNVHRRN